MKHQNNEASSRQLKLWLISAELRGYDVYRSAVVAAESEEEARRIHPRQDSGIVWNDTEYEWVGPDSDSIVDQSWVRHPDLVTVKEIGTALPGTEPGVITSAFFGG